MSGAGKDFVEGVEALDHFLAATGAGVNGLQADRAAVQQMLGSRPRIVQREHTETVEYHVTRAFAKQRRPALGRCGQMTAQTVADGFGTDEVMFDKAAPQITRTVDTEFMRAGGSDNGLRR